MKNIEIDEELYQYIASNTQYIGESASAILRRLLQLDVTKVKDVTTTKIVSEPKVEQAKPTKTVQAATETLEEQTSVFDFINKEELAMQRGAVGRFLLILAALYRAHPKEFDVVTDISGRDRLYFAHSEEELAASGSSTKPRQIPESHFWVITNSNTTRKKMMLTKAASSLGYKDVEVEKIRELL